MRLPMTTVTSKSHSAWRAEVTWESRWIRMPVGTPEGEMEETPENETEVRFLKVWDCFVDVFRPGCELRFERYPSRSQFQHQLEGPQPCRVFA
jgi:hypothetical protein